MVSIMTIKVMLEGTLVTLTGRLAWALTNLMTAGEPGCSFVDYPAPRWPGYVHMLRSRGFHIETIKERHGGQFPGYHARYVLRSKVRVAKKAGAPE